MSKRGRKRAPRGDTVTGTRSDNAELRDYSPMKATNTFTGKLQEVVLIDPARLQRLSALQVTVNRELRMDLILALSKFTFLQRRVLIYVLLQGMSVEQATARMKKSSSHWRRWLYGEALPKLRETLRDYRELTETRGAVIAT